ncbi:MAG: hypothetical protein VXB94_13855, partial [Rhodobiaceae bacterium]
PAPSATTPSSSPTRSAGEDCPQGASMILRTVGPSSTPVWREILMRLFAGSDPFGDEPAADEPAGDEPTNGVAGTTGRMMGDVWS